MCAPVPNTHTYIHTHTHTHTHTHGGRISVAITGAHTHTHTHTHTQTHNTRTEGQATIATARATTRVSEFSANSQRQKDLLSRRGNGVCSHDTRLGVVSSETCSRRRLKLGVTDRFVLGNIRAGERNSYNVCFPPRSDCVEAK